MTLATLHLAYDENNIRPGWVALLIVLALAIATFLLWRSMNSQLRKIDLPRQRDARAKAGTPPEDDDETPPSQ